MSNDLSKNSNNKTFNREQEIEKINLELKKNPYLKRNTLIQKALISLENRSDRFICWLENYIGYSKVWYEMIN